MNEMEQPPPGRKARHRRTRTRITARVKIGTTWSDAMILNVSKRGMMITTDLDARRGDYVDVRRGADVSIAARVVWRNAERVGLRTQDDIDLALLSVEPTRRKAVAGMQTDRRSASRGEPQRRAERSRTLSSAMQFGVALIAIAVAAAYVVDGVRSAFSAPMAAVNAALGGDAARKDAARPE